MTEKQNPAFVSGSRQAQDETRGQTIRSGKSVAPDLAPSTGSPGGSFSAFGSSPPASGTPVGAASASGLVSPSTSPTEFAVDPVLARLSRMRRSTLTASVEIEKRPPLPGFRKPRAVGVTLTYRRTDQWRPKHVSEFVDRLQKWAKRRGIELPFVWVAELQQRGAVHYHAIVWLPRHLMLPKPDKQGWWPHGSTRVEQLRCGAAYASKYASKGLDGAKFPKGLRLHGRGGLTRDERRTVRWWNLAKWVRDHFGEAVRDVVKIIGGYVARDDGEWLASPWRVRIDGGGRVWVFRVA